MEINLSSKVSSVEGLEEGAKTSLTHSPDHTNSGFRSMDYVPGSGGTYAAMGSGSQGTQSGTFPGMLPDSNHDAPEEEKKSGKGSTSALRILVIVFSTTVLGVGGFFALSTLEDGGEFNLDSMISGFLGFEDDMAIPDSEPGTTPTDKVGTNTPKSGKEIEEIKELPDNQPTLTSGPGSEMPPDSENLNNMVIDDGMNLSESSVSLPDQEGAMEPEELQNLPYIYLIDKNKTDMTEPLPMGNIWSAQQEQAWRRGIAHRFPWQRYKTVMEVKSGRLVQSQVILYDALGDSRFWTRMRAVMALAEFGVQVSMGSVKRVINGVSKPLVARFFKRFHAKNSPGERYVMRISLAFTSPEGRVNILRSLLGYSIDLENHGLYLAAAFSDPDKKVQELAYRFAKRLPPSVISQHKSQFWELTKNPLPVSDEIETLPAPQVEVNPTEQPPIELDQIQIYDAPETLNEDGKLNEYDVQLEGF